MKPSGIEWIGDIPDDWEVRKLLSLFKEHKDRNKNLEEQNLLSLSYGKIKRKDINNNDGLLPASFETYNIVEKGDIVFRLTDLQNDKRSLRTGIVTQRGIITSAYVTIRPKIKLDSRFYHYLYHMYDICKVFYGMGDGVRQGMGFEDLKNIPTLIPPLKTQQKIADYLDEKCGEIDATIAKQKESIEKLKAYKQSLISETVTKGLDKSAPLKPSGIDYLGDIPAHWEVKRIKELFSFGKGLPISKEDLIENGVPVINYGQIHSKDNNGTSIKDSLIRYVDLNYKNTNMTSLVESGDFIFADTSEDLDGCGNCIYVDSKYPIFAGYHCIILRSIKRNSSKYLAYLFQMDAWRTQIRRDVTGVKVFSISKKILGKSYILFPPRYEQECIVNYLQEKCNEIDVIINKKQNIIQKLDAYKKSLIFECVTGKQKI